MGIEKVLEGDPGDPRFVEVAEELRKSGTPLQALEICLRGLSANPDLHQGRLLLARLYVDLECLPFAVRELQTLSSEFPEMDPLNRLIERIAPGTSGLGTGELVTGGETESAESARTVADLSTDDGGGAETNEGDLPESAAESERELSDMPPVSSALEDGSTLAEADFDFDELDMMDEE